MLVHTLFLIGILAGAAADSGEPASIAAAAQQLLDDKADSAKKAATIKAHADRAGELIAELARGLGDNSAEEYRRIPWIWRVAFAAGKRNDVNCIREVLDIALPQPNQPLRDWQSVVIGGGLINGLTEVGVWPASRLETIIGEDAALSLRWKQALEKSTALANDEKVNRGTRYDALRMVAMLGWERGGPQLKNYLAKGTHRELQMGAVSGCGDIDDPKAAETLIEALPTLDPTNAPLAVKSLRRNASRKALLDAAVASGKVSAALTKER